MINNKDCVISKRTVNPFLRSVLISSDIPNKVLYYIK